MLSRGSLPAPFQGPPRPKPCARAGERLATRFPPRLSASHLFSVLFFSFGVIVLFVCFSWPDGCRTMFTLLLLLSQLPIVTFSFPHCTRGPQEARHAGEGEQTNPSYVCGSQRRKGSLVCQGLASSILDTLKETLRLIGGRFGCVAVCCTQVQ